MPPDAPGSLQRFEIDISTKIKWVLTTRNTGGAKGIRTPDLFHAMEARYQLRHSPAGCSVPVPTGPNARSILQARHDEMKSRRLPPGGPQAAVDVPAKRRYHRCPARVTMIAPTSEPMIPLAAGEAVAGQQTDRQAADEGAD
jgi:hypothetical protein